MRKTSSPSPQKYQGIPVPCCRRQGSRAGPLSIQNRRRSRGDNAFPLLLSTGSGREGNHRRDSGLSARFPDRVPRKPAPLPPRSKAVCCCEGKTKGLFHPIPIRRQPARSFLPSLPHRIVSSGRFSFCRELPGSFPPPRPCEDSPLSDPAERPEKSNRRLAVQWKILFPTRGGPSSAGRPFPFFLTFTESTRTESLDATCDSLTAT